MKYSSSLVPGFVSFLMFSCATSSITERPTLQIEPIEGARPYTSLDLNNDPTNFQFAIVTDRTGGHRDGVFEEGIAKLNLLQPEFVMSVGDLIEGYTEDQARLEAEWTEFNGFIDSLTVPFFYVPGNHDITNKVMYDKWKELFGRDYYHFVYKDVLFLCLNSEDNYRGAGKGTIGDEQYEWIAKTLAENAGVKWTLVFMHQPLWAQQAETLRWPDVENLLENRKHTVFVGHHHSYVKYERNNGKYFILATTGGGSGLRGPRFGEFDHVVWITMTENGPIMANLMLSGIWDENIVTDKMSEYFRPLVNGQPLRISPLFVDGSNFSEGETELRITNDSDAPMDVDFEFDGHEQLITQPVRQRITIAPNTVEVLPVSLRFVGAPVSPMEPVTFNAEITYQGEGMPDLTMQVKKNVKPERREYVMSSSNKKIDGDLADWASLPYQENERLTEANPFSHKGGKADGSVRFGITYDDQYLYVGAEVTDDELLSAETLRPSGQDAFQLVIDGRAEGISSFATSHSGVLVASISPGIGFKNAEGVKGVAIQTTKGYNVEMAIPLSNITAGQGVNWNSLRINVMVNDFDNNYSHKTVMWWKPDWRGSSNYAGSGTFFRKAQ